jgi:hypothetical protein
MGGIGKKAARLFQTVGFSPTCWRVTRYSTTDDRSVLAEPMHVPEYYDRHAWQTNLKTWVVPIVIEAGHRAQVICVSPWSLKVAEGHLA